MAGHTKEVTFVMDTATVSDPLRKRDCSLSVWAMFSRAARSAGYSPANTPMISVNLSPRRMPVAVSTGVKFMPAVERHIA